MYFGVKWVKFRATIHSFFYDVLVQSFGMLVIIMLYLY